MDWTARTGKKKTQREGLSGFRLLFFGVKMSLHRQIKAESIRQKVNQYSEKQPLIIDSLNSHIY